MQSVIRPFIVQSQSRNGSEGESTSLAIGNDSEADGFHTPSASAMNHTSAAAAAAFPASHSQGRK